MDHYIRGFIWAILIGVYVAFSFPLISQARGIHAGVAAFLFVLFLHQLLASR